MILGDFYDTLMRSLFFHVISILKFSIFNARDNHIKIA